MEKGPMSMERRVIKFNQRALVFMVNIDTDDLTNSMIGLAYEQHICNTILGPLQPAQVFFTKWQDKNGKPLLFYLAKQWQDTPVLKDDEVSATMLSHHSCQLDLIICRNCCWKHSTIVKCRPIQLQVLPRVTLPSMMVSV
jgi:hypothetical protein